MCWLCCVFTTSTAATLYINECERRFSFSCVEPTSQQQLACFWKTTCSYPQIVCSQSVYFCVSLSVVCWLAKCYLCRTTERFVLCWGRSGCRWVEYCISGSASCMCDDDNNNNNDDDNNEFSCTGVYLNHPLMNLQFVNKIIWFV